MNSSSIVSLKITKKRLSLCFRSLLAPKEKALKRVLASFGMGAHALADELSVAGKNQLSDPQYIAPNRCYGQ